jgi:hypothetical protein
MEHLDAYVRPLDERDRECKRGTHRQRVAAQLVAPWSEKLNSFRPNVSTATNSDSAMKI